MCASQEVLTKIQKEGNTLKQETILRNGISNDKPFVTIGITNYNYGKYLRRAFEAIQRQKFRDLELIYADNNSTDDSLNIIKKIAEDADVPVCIVTGENLGICGNRNRILDHARGKYLMIWDADDWMTEDCLEILCKTAMKTGADQVVGDYRKVDDAGRILYHHCFPDTAVKWSTWGYHGSLYRMSVLQKNNIRFDTAWRADDSCFSALFHKYSKSIVFVHHPVDNWYKHNDSLTSMYSERVKRPETAFNSADSFEITASFMEEIWKTVPKKDQEQLEYMWSMMYYYVVLYRRPARRFRDDMQEYRKLHQVMLMCFPNYLKNIALRRIDGKGYYRKKVTAAIFILAILERIHLITPALWGYWLLTHVYHMGY